MKYVLKNRKGMYLIHTERTTHTGIKIHTDFTSNIENATINPIWTHTLRKEFGLELVQVVTTIREL